MLGRVEGLGPVATQIHVCKMYTLIALLYTVIYYGFYLFVQCLSCFAQVQVLGCRLNAGLRGLGAVPPCFEAVHITRTLRTGIQLAIMASRVYKKSS